MKLQKPLLLTTTLIGTSLIFSACSLPFLSSRQAASDSPTTQTQNPNDQMGEAAEMMTALQAGQSLKCTIVSADTANSFDYYIQGKKFKMSSSTLVDGTTQISHAINDGEYLYTWSEAENKGIKMKMPSEEELKAQAEKYEEYTKNAPDITNEAVVSQYEQNGYTIACDPTTISTETFTPPTTVTLQDLSSVMEGATKMYDAASTQMTPEQRQQFEAAMKQYQQ